MDSELDTLVRGGDVIDGKYRVERVLGAGGMGVVLEVMHLDLCERKAIKLMRSAMLPSTDLRQRFMREARALTKLKSQHVVKVHDVGKLDGQSPYIVMEYLDGSDFHTILAERGVLPVGEAIMYILQACEAIGEAHAAGIVHRDLKPGNLFLTRSMGGAPCVKVLDFGIAKMTDDIHMTSTDATMGSPLFMSPDQITSTSTVDSRTDIWSLGVILYFFTTGALPFEGSSRHLIMNAVLSSPPKPPSARMPDVSRELEEVILRCIEKDPTKRYTSVGELQAALLSLGESPSRVSFAAMPMSPGAGAAPAPQSPVTETAPRNPAGRLSFGKEALRSRVLTMTLPEPGITPSPRAPRPSITQTTPVSSDLKVRLEPMPRGISQTEAVWARSGEEPSRYRTTVALGVTGALALLVASSIWLDRRSQRDARELGERLQLNATRAIPLRDWRSREMEAESLANPGVLSEGSVTAQRQSSSFEEAAAPPLEANFAGTSPPYEATKGAKLPVRSKPLDGKASQVLVSPGSRSTSKIARPISPVISTSAVDTSMNAKTVPNPYSRGTRGSQWPTEANGL